MSDSPPTRLVQTNLPSLINALHAETDFFRLALDSAVLTEADLDREELKDMTQEKGQKLQNALASINHMEVIIAAIKENPEAAARAIMPSIYLVGASFTAQEIDLADDVVQGVTV